MGQIRDDKLLQAIALKLKAMRQAIGKSQIEVFNDTDIHIGRIEAGQANVSISTLAAICKYYKTTLAELFTSLNF
jgi:transcriptional regulator with XRE-family HTH domain